MATPVTVNEVLDGQVALDLRCLDRIYLNAYVPNLQVGGQVVSFFDRALGPSTMQPATRFLVYESHGLVGFGVIDGVPC
jgi:hypothetical protein